MICHGLFRAAAAAVMWAAIAGTTAVAAAQELIELSIEPADMGVEGVCRAGDWAGARLTLESSELTARSVICRWVIRDIDGDRLVSQRRVVVNPGVEQTLWLYAPLPMDWTDRSPCRFDVVDAATGAGLASTVVLPTLVLPPQDAAVGLFTNAPLGMDAYIRRNANGQRLDLLHEQVALVRGLSASRMPDRWYGLDLFGVLIWTDDGDSFDAADVSPDTQRALVDWVRRGGHFVVSLPAAGDPWLGLPSNHPLSPLLPFDTRRARRIDGPPPTWLGRSLALTQQQTVTRTVFDLPLEGLPGVSVVARDDEGQPIGVSHRVGFGRVTLLGVDLADRRLTIAGLPRSEPPHYLGIWADLLGWQAPALERALLDSEIDENNFGRPHLRADAFLDDWFAGRTDRPGTVATALLLAILAFGLYWLLAGPVAYGVLRAKHLQQRSWVVFAGVVGVFTAVCWVGAWVLRPATENVTHVSVVDFIAGERDARVTSWFSLFLPSFGAQEIDLGPDTPDAANTLVSPGLDRRGNTSTYPDPQTYAVNAAAPHTYPPPDLPSAGGVPFRSTAKTFVARDLGPIDERTAGLTDQWVPPQGDLRVENGFPTGQLSHGLPGTLVDTIAVYWPGGDAPRARAFSGINRGNDSMPRVYRLGDWPPNTIMQLGPPNNVSELVHLPNWNASGRQWSSEGFLGVQVNNIRGGTLSNLGPGVALANDRLTTATYLLSFFNYLPAVDYRNTSMIPGQQAFGMRRSLGRALDLSHLVSGRRIIILGVLRDSPSPLPLTANGDPVPSNGWTVVRWIHDLD
ncbi:MAG: hypothetical protein AAGK09_04190 [Planctomycetota bacterium]